MSRSLLIGGWVKQQNVVLRPLPSNFFIGGWVHLRSHNPLTSCHPCREALINCWRKYIISSAHTHTHTHTHAHTHTRMRTRTHTQAYAHRLCLLICHGSSHNGPYESPCHPSCRIFCALISPCLYCSLLLHLPYIHTQTT